MNWSMNMDIHSALMGLGGGAIIGTAAGLLLLLNGRIAGISGILGGLLRTSDSDRAWRLWFVMGLVAGGLILRFGYPDALPIDHTVVAPHGWVLVLLAGLLVGFGTRLGSGCTSGHGVCGVSRLSRRSLLATIVFIAAGMVTVLVTTPLMGG